MNEDTGFIEAIKQGNLDDVLIFDSDVSKEYLRLYQSGCLTAEELNDIRINGLRKLRGNTDE